MDMRYFSCGSFFVDRLVPVCGHPRAQFVEASFCQKWWTCTGRMLKHVHVFSGFIHIHLQIQWTSEDKSFRLPSISLHILMPFLSCIFSITQIPYPVFSERSSSEPELLPVKSKKSKFAGQGCEQWEQFVSGMEHFLTSGFLDGCWQKF